MSAGVWVVLAFIAIVALIAYRVVLAIRGARRREALVSAAALRVLVGSEPDGPVLADVAAERYIRRPTDEFRYVDLFQETQAASLRTADADRFGDSQGHGPIRFACRWDSCDGTRKPGVLFCAEHPAVAAVTA